MTRLTICLLLLASVAAANPLEVPFVHQEKDGCGAAAVAMVMHYWSNFADPATVYGELQRDDVRGIRLADMRDYADGHGLTAFTFRGAAADLEAQLAKGRPVVVGLKKNQRGGLHFVVVAGLDDEQVWLNDPARRAPRKMKRAQFDRQWEAAERWLLLAAPRSSQ